MKDRCYDCIHTNVCNLKDTYKKVNEQVDNISTTSDIRINVLCDHYQKEKDWSTRI